MSNVPRKHIGIFTVEPEPSTITRTAGTRSSARPPAVQQSLSRSRQRHVLGRRPMTRAAVRWLLLAALLLPACSPPLPRTSPTVEAAPYRLRRLPPSRRRCLPPCLPSPRSFRSVRPVPGSGQNGRCDHRSVPEWFPRGTFQPEASNAITTSAVEEQSESGIMIWICSVMIRHAHGEDIWVGASSFRFAPPIASFSPIPSAAWGRLEAIGLARWQEGCTLKPPKSPKALSDSSPLFGRVLDARHGFRALIHHRRAGYPRYPAGLVRLEMPLRRLCHRVVPSA